MVGEIFPPQKQEKFPLCKSRLCLVGGGLKDGQYFPWRARTPPPVPPHPATRWIAPNHIFPRNPPNTQNVSLAAFYSPKIHLTHKMFQRQLCSSVNIIKNIPNGRSHESGINLYKVLNKGGNYCCYSKILLRIQNIFSRQTYRLVA